MVENDNCVTEKTYDGIWYFRNLNIDYFEGGYFTQAAQYIILNIWIV